MRFDGSTLKPTHVVSQQMDLIHNWQYDSSKKKTHKNIDVFLF